ncbi:DUF3667 domain-containing protein [Sphingomonas daechungensis]|uniref:DUF3667 domain-containing protein n=1 Tax=Sphingomonas daechungensis TaxID=1176646 RepID=UPI003783D33C
MSDLEAIGDAATGAVLGGAVESRSGAGSGHTHEKNCLNCGAQLVGEYCHACGQKSHVHRTLHAFWHDLLHGVLHFEGKVWHTLPMLAWRPGDLTRRYIDGERAKFVSPMALFLFSVFLMFAVASFSGDLSPRISPDAPAELQKSISSNERQIADLQRQRDAAVRANRPTAPYDAKIADLQQDLAVMRGVQQGEIGRIAKTRIDAPDWLSKPLEKAVKNPDLMFYKLKTNAYKFSWMLIPLSVPFLWLLFPFSRRFRLYDHTVFVTYSLSFMTLLVVTAMLIGLAGLPQVAGFAMLVPPFHIYRQLKGTYGLSGRSALVRTILLVTFSIVALTLFFLALFALGLFD